MWQRTLLLLLIALPISAVAIGTAARTVNELFDPCVSWGIGESGAGHIYPHDPCGTHTGYEKTRTQTCITLAAIQGVMLLAAVLGIWGAARSRPKIMLLAGIVMILEMIPTVFSAAPLAVLTGAGFIFMGIRLQNQQRLRS
jgi:hypothetical protein